MSNENAPREALADDQHPIGLAIANGFATGEWIARWSHRLKSPLTEAELFDFGVRWSVKEVIQYLWQRADDPEVVEAVVLSGMLFPERHDEFHMKHERLLAAGYIHRVLTALLGHRPSGEEAE